MEGKARKTTTANKSVTIKSVREADQQSESHPEQGMTATGERKPSAEIMDSAFAAASTDVKIKKIEDGFKAFEKDTKDEAETSTHKNSNFVIPDRHYRPGGGDDTHSDIERPRRNEPWKKATIIEFESRNEEPRRNKPWKSTRTLTANGTHEMSGDEASQAQLRKFIEQQSNISKESIKLLAEIKTILKHQMYEKQTIMRSYGINSLSQKTEQDGKKSSRKGMSNQKWRDCENKMDKATATNEFDRKMQRTKRAIEAEQTRAYGSADLAAQRRASKICFKCGEQGHFARNCTAASEQRLERQKREQKRETVFQLKEITQHIQQICEKLCTGSINEKKNDLNQNDNEKGKA